MLLKFLLIGSLCCLGLAGCANSVSSKVLKSREAEVLAVAKIGAKFEDVRAAVIAVGYRCTEPRRIQSVVGPSAYRFCQVILEPGFPWQATFNESTGYNHLRMPRYSVGIRIDDDGIIIGVQ